jgi:hypothetical protein
VVNHYITLYIMKTSIAMTMDKKEKFCYDMHERSKAKYDRRNY